MRCGMIIGRRSRSVIKPNRRFQKEILFNLGHELIINEIDDACITMARRCAVSATPPIREMPSRRTRLGCCITSAPAEIGRVLGARYLLEGSIRRSGDRVCVNVELTDAETGRHLWSEAYDSEVKDIFAVQEDIARRVDAAFYNGARAELSKVAELTVPPRDATAFEVPAGHFFRIVSVQGPQVGDLNLWNAHDLTERLYSGKTRAFHATHLTPGDRLWSTFPT